MVPGRDNCEHYSLLPTPANTGEPGVVSSQECQVLEERGFFNCSFSAMEFQRAQFAPVSQRWGNAERPVREGVEEPCPGFSHGRLKGEVV